MPKPSELIRIHIAGSGTGYELDDLTSRWRGALYDEISDRIFRIHEKFRTSEYRIGTSNPASFGELSQLADELDRRGY